MDKETKKYTCQECGGYGGERVPILDFGIGPWEECPWCDGTGEVDGPTRARWLNIQRWYPNKEKNKAKHGEVRWIR
jgi:hypothetical protein